MNKLKIIDNETIKKFTFNWINISGLFKQVQLIFTNFLEKNEMEEEKIIQEQKEEILHSDSSDKRDNKVTFRENPKSKKIFNFFLNKLLASFDSIRKKSDNVKSFQKIEEKKDNIFSDLKLIKFEGIYKKEMTLEDVNKEMMKLIDESANIPQNNEKTSNTKFSRQSVNSNIIPDYAYPFKQDKLSCFIL